MPPRTWAGATKTHTPNPTRPRMEHSFREQLERIDRLMMIVEADNPHPSARRSVVAVDLELPGLLGETALLADQRPNSTAFLDYSPLDQCGTGP